MGKANGNDDNYNIIPEYASYKSSFEIYSYVDSSTANFNSHVCPCVLASNQQQLKAVSQALMSPLNQKVLKVKKKEMTNMLARWIADSMRTFFIVNDDSFTAIIEKCMEIGKKYDC